LSLKNNVIDGYQEVLSGHAQLPTLVEIHGSKIRASAVQLVANSNGASGANILEVVRAAPIANAVDPPNTQAQNQIRATNVGGQTQSGSLAGNGTFYLLTNEASNGEAVLITRRQVNHSAELGRGATT
jgi:hypothetical protein